MRVLWDLEHAGDGLVGKCDRRVVRRATPYILYLRVLQDPVVTSPQLSLGPIEKLKVRLLGTNLALEAEELRDE